MELDKYLKTVKNLNEYISFTSDIQNERINLKVPFNISTILSLKDIRSIEIEYFNKCEENGGATKIVELLLCSPPSKTWRLLGGELIFLLQYWLEAIRKHLILRNIHWWTFLKLILKFIKDISQKDASLNKILIEELAECLLDLATNNVPDTKQRNEILQTFNAISAESSRKIRMGYREKFEQYFIKLSMLLTSAGDFPLQHRILESLLRWLLPRHDLDVRQAAADKWFPDNTYSRCAVKIFLERPWQDFMKDARDFLNAQNKGSDLVTSVMCKTFSVGKQVYLKTKQENQCWLDFNSSTKCMSILLHPKWDMLGGDESCDVVVLSDENTTSVELKQVSQQVVITMTVLEWSRVYPFSSDVIVGINSESEIDVSVSSRSDISRLDVSLRCIFGEKYKMSLDINDSALCVSPDNKLSNSDVINGTEEDTRFSMPPEVYKRKHSGYIVRPRNPGSWNSPSTVSTSSLAQLHEKLAALPRYTFDKEPVSVCALPQLSTVSEVSEIDEYRTNNSSLSTIKFRRYGVCQKRINKSDSKTSHSTSNDSNEKRNLSPVVNDDENSVSCLLLATIGSADDSIISDTIGRLPKNVPCNTDNIVDLLAQEALEGSTVRHNIGVDIESNKKTPHVQLVNQVLSEKPESRNKIVTQVLQENLLNEQQPVDESSNEIVENTPFSWVQMKRPKYKSAKTSDLLKPNTVPREDPDSVKLIHNIEAVENFFSQHVTENRNGDLVISPSLARKINETSSECSDDFDQCIFRAENSHKYIVKDIEIDHLFMPDSDIVECVNAMVDKVCEDLDKCAKYINLVDEVGNDANNTRAKRTRRKLTNEKDVDGQDFKNNVNVNVPKPKEKLNNSTKVKLPMRKLVSTKKTSKNITKPKKEQPFVIMSPIIERDSIISNIVPKNNDSLVESPNNDITTSLIRRKRKLYSPKDETCHEKKNIHSIETIEDDSNTNVELKACSKTPHSIATCYKEIEQERKKRIRRPRSRLSLKKSELSISPRTLKMNKVFDSLKDVIDGEPVKLVDKMQLRNDTSAFNYTSDSEDEDEKKTKTKTSLKKVSSAATDSGKSVAVGKSGKKTNKTMKTTEITDEGNKKGVKGTRKLKKRTITKRDKENVSKIPVPIKRNLDDERMRGEAPEILNTSLLFHPEHLEKAPDKHSDPVLSVVPQMEPIIEDNFKPEGENIKENQPKCKTKRTLSLKRNKDIPKSNLDISMADNDGTVSPLPGLVVETILATDIDVNDSVSANMFQKFKDIYEGNRVTDSEVNTTQNLLSDFNEPINYSPSNLNITEELNRGDDKHSESERKEVKKIPTKKKIKKIDKGKIKVKVESQSQIKKLQEDPDAIQLSVIELNSERSMATMGNSHSPITAHGDFDESPPNPTLLNENIQPRIVEQEYLNQSIKDFFSKLTDQLNESSRENDSDLKGDNKSNDDHSSNKSGSTNSPVVVMTRLSPEYIRSRASVNSSLANTNNSHTNLNLNSSSKSCKSNSENRNTNNVESDKGQITRAVGRKSNISPINICKDFKTTEAEVISPRSESEDDCVKRIKNIFASKKQVTIESNSSPTEINKPAHSKLRQRNNAASSSISTPSAEHEREETSRSVVNSLKASKRKTSPILGSLKKSKYNEENNNFGSTITDSGPSVASVNEWFKRNEPTCTADTISLSIKENLKNVLEKLDTTLVEIHHNTSKRFINMFVGATTHLNDLKEKRRELHRQTASEIMSSVVKIVDDKFLELNNRLQSMDDQFMDTLKKQAHDLVQEECKQKRVMVTLLREDVQAVMDHLEKARGSK